MDLPEPITGSQRMAYFDWLAWVTCPLQRCEVGVGCHGCQPHQDHVLNGSSRRNQPKGSREACWTDRCQVRSLATSVSYSSLIAPLSPRGRNPLIHLPGVGRWETHIFSCQLGHQCVSVCAAPETRTWVCVVYLRDDPRCTGKEGVSKTRKRR